MNRTLSAGAFALTLLAMLPTQARGDEPASVMPPVTPTPIADPLAPMTALATERAGTLSESDRALFDDILSSMPVKVAELNNILGTASHGFSGPECLTASRIPDAAAELKPLIATSVIIFNGTTTVELDAQQADAMKHAAALIAVDGLQTVYWTVNAPLSAGFLTPDQPHAPVFLSVPTLLHGAGDAHICLTYGDLATTMVEASLVHLQASLPDTWRTDAARAKVAAGFLASLSGYDIR